MLKKINKVIKNLKPILKPKHSIKTYKYGNSFYAFKLKARNVRSLKDLRDIKRSFDKIVTKVYKDNPRSQLDLSCWILAMHPGIADHYNVRYHKGQLDLFYQFLKEKGIKQIISYKEYSPLIPEFEIITLDGKVKHLHRKEASDVLFAVPSFTLELENEKTRKRLRELKLIQ